MAIEGPGSLKLRLVYTLGERIQVAGDYDFNGATASVGRNLAMHDVKGTVIGEFKDDRWHIRYSVPTSGDRSATIWVNDLWAEGRAYTLFGSAAPQ